LSFLAFRSFGVAYNERWITIVLIVQVFWAENAESTVDHQVFPFLLLLFALPLLWILLFTMTLRTKNVGRKTGKILFD